MKHTKKPIAIIRLKLLANKAAPSPILGQALGQYSINIMDFCKSFNNQTKNIKDTITIPINITIYNPNSFEIMLKTPSTSTLLKNIVVRRNTLIRSSMKKSSEFVPVEHEGPLEGSSGDKKDLLAQKDQNKSITKKKDGTVEKKTLSKSVKKSSSKGSLSTLGTEGNYPSTSTGAVLLKEIYHIALFKKSNRLMHHLPLNSICKSILGSIKSIGLTITSQPTSSRQKK